MEEEVLKLAKGVAKAARSSAPGEEDSRAVLQVERRDYVDLAPENRPRVQGLEGFDECSPPSLSAEAWQLR